MTRQRGRKHKKSFLQVVLPVKHKSIVHILVIPMNETLSHSRMPPSMHDPVKTYGSIVYSIPNDVVIASTFPPLYCIGTKHMEVNTMGLRRLGNRLGYYLRGEGYRDEQWTWLLVLISIPP